MQVSYLFYLSRFLYAVLLLSRGSFRFDVICINIMYRCTLEAADFKSPFNPIW
jgi:hypothetical protein